MSVLFRPQARRVRRQQRQEPSSKEYGHWAGQQGSAVRSSATVSGHAPLSASGRTGAVNCLVHALPGSEEDAHVAAIPVSARRACSCLSRHLLTGGRSFEKQTALHMTCCSPCGQLKGRIEGGSLCRGWERDLVIAYTAACVIMTVAHPCTIEAHGSWLSTVPAATSAIGAGGCGCDAF